MARRFTIKRTVICLSLTALFWAFGVVLFNMSIVPSEFPLFLFIIGTLISFFGLLQSQIWVKKDR